MGTYDAQQVCLNGHQVTDSYNRRPEFRSAFCKQCGAATIHACQACGVAIRGDYDAPGVVVIGSETSVPKFCHACGQPYPWTSSKIEAAKALASEVDELTDADRILLSSSIDDLIADTPKTSVAIVRFKRLAAKGGKEIADGFRRTLVDIVSEAARKSIWG